MPETTTHQLVVFSLGSEEYALPIGAVHGDHPLQRVAARMGMAPSEPGNGSRPSPSTRPSSPR